MKKIKSLSFIAVILAFTLALTGCVKGYVNQGKYGREQVTEILRCFDEKDVSALKAMFCEKVASEHDLDKEIEAAMNLYNGKSVSHDKVQFGGGEAASRGVITDSHIGYSINNIETDNESVYRIVTHSYIVYQDDSSCIGITYLTLIDEKSSEEVEIGEYVK